MQDPGRYGDFIFAIVLFLTGWLLISKRRPYFPRFAKAILLVIALLSFVDLVWGWSVSQLWSWVTFSK